ncbi:hypothetical protein B0A50_08737 [Salinomyces thailandicus]|uniref:DNA/RNA-binding domain-containing protein n=1 Tax=Salinomyces thailandicus TaxID=706561 RepID=A0A4U0TJW4_9PEZI|nr:hypothetical protein B0A50_08737 [Salinomyces thailandica]
MRRSESGGSCVPTFRERRKGGNFALCGSDLCMGSRHGTKLHHQEDDSKPTLPLPLMDAEPRLKPEVRHHIQQGKKPQGNTPDTAMILQPKSSLISQSQLAAEIKSIYAGLVIVEAKCISLDATQAKDTAAELSSEQWEVLIALHRTLLYEHHDFFMATQHPAAISTFAGLATKYSMPARMWKHGIHTFLEILCHGRPASQEYLLTFINIAYSMMALLYETVPNFVDTWAECLGDLARYRMAIEEDREIHAQWGGVAAR